MLLSDQQTVGRNSQRFRHRTSQATAFGGTALRSALRQAGKATNLENAVNRLIFFVAASFYAVLITGCATNPTEFRDEIQKAKSITIVCCDTTATASVQNTLGMVLGGGSGLLARSSIIGSKNSQTDEFYRNAGGQPLTLPLDFLNALQIALSERGYVAIVQYPHSFDGSQNTWSIDYSRVATQLILEVRYAGQIAEHGSRYFPTLAASFNVRRASDRKILNWGYLATSDSGLTSPLVLGVERLRSPILSAISTSGAVMFAHIVTLDASQTVVGGEAQLMKDARRLYVGTETANRDMAKLLAKQIGEPRPR